MRWSKMVAGVVAVGVWLIPTGERVEGRPPDGCWGFNDCNGNGVDDDCDVSCANAGTFCVYGFPAIAGCDSGYFSSCGTSSDCNDNRIPDVCEGDCDGDGIYDPCEPDCDGDGIPDDCEPDCDGDGIPDDCEADCDGDGIPDDCEADIADKDCDGDGVCNGCEIDCGTAGGACDVPGCGGNDDCDLDGLPDECNPDCDGDGIIDVCESHPAEQDCDGDGVCNGCEIDCGIAGGPCDVPGCGGSDDCNGNWLPDVCETNSATSTFTFKSGALSPLRFPMVQTYTFYSAPDAVDEVTLSFEAVGDLDSDDDPESVRVRLYPCVLPGCGDCFGGWCSIGNVFDGPGEGSACTGTPDVDTVPVSADLFNAIVEANGGNLDIQMTPTINVGSCIGSYIAATVSYETANDCNGNGVPDECDIAEGTSQDCGGPGWAANGIPDECDIANCPQGEPGCADCDTNDVPDGCDPDCDEDGTPDACETAAAEQDCDNDGTCNGDEIAACPGDPACSDCTENQIPDECDILIDDGGLCDPAVRPDCSPDCQNGDPTEPGYGVPDVCEPNCDGDAVPDFCEIRDCPAGDTSCGDCNANNVPDGCDIDPSDPDGNGQVSADCQPAGDPGSSVPDECDIDPSDPDADGYVSPNCNENAIPDECEPDCNGNGIADDCDISAGTSQDCDDTGVPDECEPAAEVAGSRYVELTPEGFFEDDFGQNDWMDPNTSYTIQVSPFLEGLYECDPYYVLDGGTLTDDPLLADSMTPAQWCTEYLRDAVVIPDAIYGIAAWDPNGIATVLGNIRTWPWGDVDQDDTCWLWDVVCVLNCFGGRFTESCTPYSCDQAPPVVQGQCAAPDGHTDILDMLAVVDACLNYVSYPCPEPCYTSPPSGSGSASPVAALTVDESPHSISPGDYVDVDVFVSEVSELRAYEVSVDVTGGTNGSLTLVDAFVTTTRSDYVFYELVGDDEDVENADYYDAVDIAGGRIAGLLRSGFVNASAEVYVGTFRYQASGNANGTFTATAVIQDTTLLDSANTEVGVDSTTSTTIWVSNRPVFRE